jgi:predicted dehydrogenase
MSATGEVRLVTFDPGHFHAALVQKEMYEGVARRVHVYAPLGADLLAHLGRVAAFNARPAAPTAWELEVHAGPEPLARLLAERPGDAVVISGRNRGKIDAILAALEAGLHVLADKPWVIRADDLPTLRRALEVAEERGLVALDIMTERHEVTTRLQRELIHDAEVFGTIDAGTPERPGVEMESEHFLIKTVAGPPLRRPAWFFDVEQQGEGLSDVGTHLVDLVPWVLFPGDPIAVEEVQLLAARRWPTLLSGADFQRATGERPPADSLAYDCNNAVSYRLRGVHVALNVLWGVEAPPGAGDRHLARFRGTRSSVEVRQGAAERYRPEVYVVPRDPAALAGLREAVDRRLSLLQPDFPGVACEGVGGELRLTIPAELRTGHEEHFARVTRQFLRHLREPGSLPAWEKANMLAKYHVTTHGVRLARGG